MLDSVIQRKTAVLFRMFDSNGDGFWDESDFEQWFERVARSRGKELDSPEMQELSQVYMQIWEGLKGADTDGDGRVSLEEALEYQERYITPEAVAGFAQVVFPVLDADGDGEIGPDEYRAYLESGFHEPPPADDLFPLLDRNGDGRISRSEFEQLYQEFFLSTDPEAPGSSLWGPF